MRNAPFRHIGANMIGCGIEIATCPDGHALGLQRFRRKLVAFERDIDILDGKFRIRKQDAKGDMAGSVAVHAPAERQFPPQGVVDDIANDRAITRTGKAMRQTPILQSIRCRPLAVFNILENFDCRLKASTKSHVISFLLLWASHTWPRQ